MIAAAQTSACTDRAEAARFLDLLAEEAPVTFQTFDDGGYKAPGLARALHGCLDQHAEELRALNERGAGVFWMVNEGDGQGRKAENVTGVRAVFLDLDGQPLWPVFDAGVEPHAIVESSPGRWHVYWMVTGCALTQFKLVQQALAAKFGGDRAVCDLPRVMRLPGFLHRKGDPFGTRAESLSLFQPYAFDVLVQRLGLNLNEPRQPPLQKTTQDDISHLQLSSVGLPLDTLPAGPGERNRCLFKRARHVRRELPAATSPQLREIALRWHALAVDRIATKEPAATIADLVRGYAAVKSPFGATMDHIAAASAALELPPGIAALGYGEAGHRLVKLCMGLQQHEGSAPFFVSARTAGEVTGMHITDAAKIFQQLVADGVLRLVSRGAGNKASRYQFVWLRAPAGAADAAASAPPAPTECSATRPGTAGQRSN